jgi:pyruvate-formate lyase-activating enzyme
MIVVADSGPLHYLVLLDQIDLLHRFYGQVVIPDAVAYELCAAATPSAVSGWIARLPARPPQALYLFGQEMTVDVVLHDHKLTIPERHKAWTGVDNKRILENLRRAYETYPDKTFVARTPLIPSVNDDEEHIRAVLAFIKPYKNVVDYELLPYMRFGESKYGFLGKVYEMEDFNPPSPESLARLRAIIDEAFGRLPAGG